MELYLKNILVILVISLVSYLIYRRFKSSMFSSRANSVISTLILFFGFFAPILGMMNCSGWNEGSMTSSSCLLSSGFMIAYADFYYGLMLFSSFMLLVPVLIYIFLIIGIIKFLIKKDAIALGKFSVLGVVFLIILFFTGPIELFLSIIVFTGAVGGLIKNYTEQNDKETFKKCLLAMAVSIIMAGLSIVVINTVANL